MVKRKSDAHKLDEPATATSLATTQDIVRDVRRKIASQTLLPGSRIPEGELAEVYGIPRAKAREVLAALEDRGLIERLPNKGAIVSPVDMETTYQLYEVREALDTVIVRLAMHNATPDDWSELQALLGPPFEQSLKEGDIAAHVNTIGAFRDRLNQLAANPILSDHIERIYDRTRVTMRRVAVLPGRAEMGIQQYRKLLDAMMRNDVEATDRCVRDLNQSAREYIQRYKNYVL
ncbi:GntR family transcriptional regulator [Pollutimonas subterranea]|uniref:GntR family transcriptional regulator n=1 Tax=Pollutimonas subterranea TaxID=2045210 RepID=A0A2N4U6A7_9BURK|nr:GntR family transcriptional regulator [Pollutimonas subterranea]PLC50554.1 GntR family transcriptional regulator [Pollutimonas subterranea]